MQTIGILQRCPEDGSGNDGIGRVSSDIDEWIRCRIKNNTTAEKASEGETTATSCNLNSPIRNLRNGQTAKPSDIIILLQLPNFRHIDDLPIVEVRVDRHLEGRNGRLAEDRFDL